MKQATAKPGPRHGPLLEILSTAETILESAAVFFRRHGISTSQFNVLNLLEGQPEGRMVMHEMAERLLIHRSNVTLLVDRLEKADLVRREEHPTDRRSWRVILTPKGRAKVVGILPEYYKLAEELWGGIPAAEAGAIAKRLETLKTRSFEISRGMSKGKAKQ